MNKYFVDQIEAYNRTLGRPPLRCVIARTVSQGVAYTLAGLIGLTLFFILSQLANPLAHRAIAGAYQLYLEKAPVDAVRLLSEDQAIWLAEIRRTACIAYEANTMAEQAVYGRVLSPAHSEYKKCWDHLRRPTL